MGETIEDSLCAIIFNAQGLLYEILKEKKSENKLFEEMQEAMSRAKKELEWNKTVEYIKEDIINNTPLKSNDEQLEYWGC